MFSRLKELESRVRLLEAERASLLIEREHYVRDLEYMRRELEQVRSSPLVEASVVETLSDGRVVVHSSNGPNLIVYVSQGVDANALKAGTRVALNQRGSSVIEVLPKLQDVYVKAMEVIDRPDVSFNDIGGLSDQIRLLKELVVLPLTNPAIFKEVGVEPPKGALLSGPPGTGKTLLAKAVAAESKATFISTVGSELVQKFIGEGARVVRELFELAREKAPAIIFIDEIDAVGARRMDIGTSGEREVQRTFMQLISEMDGFDPLGDVKVLAATNRIDILDPALIRPGRFDRIIEIGLPTPEERKEIFRVHTRRLRTEGEVDLWRLASITEGASGADIRSIVLEAGLSAIRRGARSVSHSDLETAVSTVMHKEKASKSGQMFI
ncbi:MAG: proteasome-activating nucleotidase [Candidatus Marsarchaeota archaeon]|nr:proteasome-activating nucleotidase [Candidatus Marsarchaeota archaeon]